MSVSGKGNLKDSTVHCQQRVVRSIVPTELNSLVDSCAANLLLESTLHKVYCGSDGSGQLLMGLIGHGVCAHLPTLPWMPRWSSSRRLVIPQSQLPKVHLTSVHCQIAQGITRWRCWADTRDMLDVAFTKGGEDTTVSYNIFERGKYMCQREPRRHAKATEKDNKRKSTHRRGCLICENCLDLSRITQAELDSYPKLEFKRKAGYADAAPRTKRPPHCATCATTLAD